MLKLLVTDCTDEEGTGIVTELACVVDVVWSAADEVGEAKLELLGAGCEEGPTMTEDVFVIATGSPREITVDDVSKLLATR